MDGQISGEFGEEAAQRAARASADMPSETHDLTFLEGVTAAGIVGEIQRNAEAESAARGFLLRNVARLYAVALKSRGAQARELMLKTTPWTLGESSRVHSAHVASALAESSQKSVLRDVAAEVGVALMLPAGTARALVEQALVLAGDLPDVLTGLERGEITWSKASLVLKEWRALVEQVPTTERHDQLMQQAVLVGGELPMDCTEVEVETKAAKLVKEMIVRAPHVTASQLGAFARRRRARMGAAAHQRACAVALKQRDVWMSPEDDGLARLTAVLDAATATAVVSRVNALAQTLDDPQRCTGEKRAEVLGDLLMDGELPEGSRIPRGIRGQVSITVPAIELVAHDPQLAPALSAAVGSAAADPAYGDLADHPAPVAPACGGSKRRDEVIMSRASITADVPDGQSAANLVGYGPISTVDALRIAAGAGSWRRLLTHPDSGVVTEYGRSTYRVPAGLRSLLAVRDETCRFPGCRRQATNCDLDHTVAWENGGTTDLQNLGHLCRHHHRIKHDPDAALGTWIVHAVVDSAAPPGTGVLEWKSPTGVVRRTVPGSPTPATTRWLVGAGNGDHEPCAEPPSQDDPPPF
ncbi:HNH endonuclease signature motif containing protein [Kocuria sp.]|uniref:HNH endonuclease signature motif containing protein n=1 Tax=Kocuria sp. TaxID=1871328 RepID=UPI0026DF3460|nr:HNH endonuclease signature motif containing protein [Kocuria sp.]MDO5619507.1 DUF222 domain-containing protein [Kocuria sp.]